ncbi:MAG: branched-chain amino acid ABC transporter permease [Acidimicrobiales bacterium]
MPLPGDDLRDAVIVKVTPTEESVLGALPRERGLGLLGRLGPLPPALVVVVAIAAAFPHLVQTNYVTSVAMQVEIMVCLALGLNFVVGYAGMLDLGFAAFFAIGAYTTGLLSVDLHWPILATIAPAVVVSMIGAIFVGVPTLRLRSDYLAIITLGFGEIIQNIVNNLSQTGGPEGISGIPPLRIGSLVITSATGYYEVFLVLVVVFMAISSRVRHSRLGRAWLAIREDEDTAQAMGVKVRRYKLYAYMAGSVFGSITGSIYGSAFIAIAPPSFGFNESLLVVMAVSIGGTGSIWGAVLGAGVVVAFPELFRQFSDARLLVFGIALVLVMMLRPQGIWPETGLGVRNLGAVLRRAARRAPQLLQHRRGS